MSKWFESFIWKDSEDVRNTIRHRKQYSRLLIIAITLEDKNECPMGRLPAELIKHILDYIPRVITFKEFRLSSKAGEPSVYNVIYALETMRMTDLKRKIRRKYKGKFCANVTFHRNNNIDFTCLRDFVNGFKEVVINPPTPPVDAPYVTIHFYSSVALGHNNVATGFIAF
jgi:hypothetical protein